MPITAPNTATPLGIPQCPYVPYTPFGPGTYTPCQPPNTPLTPPILLMSPNGSLTP